MRIIQRDLAVLRPLAIAAGEPVDLSTKES